MNLIVKKNIILQFIIILFHYWNDTDIDTNTDTDTNIDTNTDTNTDIKSLMKILYNIEI